MKLPPKPVWIRDSHGDWLVTVTLVDGIQRTRRVCKTRFAERGRREWYVLEDGHHPWWLASNIDDAKDEFLLAWHGWRRPFGFVDGDSTRPIYGKGQQRRERAEVLAEIKAAYRAQRKAKQR